MKTTYSVTLANGKKVTRKSARVYTHAVVTNGGAVFGFCGSLALAEKSAASYRKHSNRTDQNVNWADWGTAHAVPVTVEE
jgi:hypothetical protein